MSLSELFFGFKPETIARHPECFTNGKVDPRSRTRTTPMQVLCVGMSRTGTASMHAALTQLGYDTYHGFRAFANIRDYELWNPAYRTKFLNEPSKACLRVDRAFFDTVLGHVDAVTDMPPASFAVELIAAYPEAKVVLMERDVEAWYGSFARVFINSYNSRLWSFIAWLDPDKVGHINTFLRESVARCQFGATNSREFHGNARGVYKAHYSEIRNVLYERGETEQRLLDFDLRSGWTPLCAFLGKNIPEGRPFPRTNEDQLIREKIMVMLVHGLRKTMAQWIKPWLLVVAVVAVASSITYW